MAEIEKALERFSYEFAPKQAVEQSEGRVTGLAFRRVPGFGVLASSLKFALLRQPISTFCLASKMGLVGVNTATAN